MLNMGVQDVNNEAADKASEVKTFSVKVASLKRVLPIKVWVPILILVLVLVGTGTLAWRANHKTIKKAAITPPSAQIATQQAYQSTKSDAETLFDEGKYDEALVAINKYLAANPPNTPEAKDYTKKLTVLGGTDYLSTKDYPKAIEFYNRSLALSTDPYDRISAIHGLATAYEAMGDKAAAIAQYKAARAIALPISNEQAASRFIVRDEKAITRLGGQL